MQHRIRRHISDDAPVALIRRLARRRDVHDKVLDAAFGSECDLGVPLADTRETVHSVARERLPRRVTGSTAMVSRPSRVMNP